MMLYFQALPIKAIQIIPSSTMYLLIDGVCSSLLMPWHQHWCCCICVTLVAVGALSSCQIGGKSPIHQTLTQTDLQPETGHQKSPTEKPFLCSPPHSGLNGWLEAARLLAEVQLPHQESQLEALWQHYWRLHDIREDKCQTISHPTCCEDRAGKGYYRLLIYSF